MLKKLRKSKNKSRVKGGNTKSLKLNLPQGPNMDCGPAFHPQWGSKMSASKSLGLPKMNNYTFNQEGKLGFISQGGKKRVSHKGTKKNKRVKGGNTSLKLNLPQGPNMDCGPAFHPQWGSKMSASKSLGLPKMNNYTFNQEGKLGFIQ